MYLFVTNFSESSCILSLDAFPQVQKIVASSFKLHHFERTEDNDHRDTYIYKAEKKKK
jgi:hypothetical protein